MKKLISLIIAMTFALNSAGQRHLSSVAKNKSILAKEDALRPIAAALSRPMAIAVSSEAKAGKGARRTYRLLETLTAEEMRRAAEAKGINLPPEGLKPKILPGVKLTKTALGFALWGERLRGCSAVNVARTIGVDPSSVRSFLRAYPQAMNFYGLPQRRRNITPKVDMALQRLQRKARAIERLQLNFVEDGNIAKAASDMMEALDIANAEPTADKGTAGRIKKILADIKYKNKALLVDEDILQLSDLILRLKALSQDTGYYNLPITRSSRRLKQADELNKSLLALKPKSVVAALCLLGYLLDFTKDTVAQRRMNSLLLHLFTGLPHEYKSRFIATRVAKSIHCDKVYRRELESEVILFFEFIPDDLLYKPEGPQRRVEETEEDYRGAPRDNIKEFLIEVSRFTLLTAVGEIKFGVLARLGDKEAKDTLFTSNLPLVISVAKKYLRTGEALAYLVSAGCYHFAAKKKSQDGLAAHPTGLMRAVEDWDPSRGIRFSTYAYHGIEMAIKSYLGDTTPVMKFPRGFQKNVHAFVTRCVKEAGLDPYNRHLTNEDIAAAIGIKEERVAELRRDMFIFSSILNATEITEVDPAADYRYDDGEAADKDEEEIEKYRRMFEKILYAMVIGIKERWKMYPDRHDMCLEIFKYALLPRMTGYKPVSMHLLAERYGFDSQGSIGFIVRAEKAILKKVCAFLGITRANFIRCISFVGYLFDSLEAYQAFFDQIVARAASAEIISPEATKLSAPNVGLSNLIASAA